MKTACRLLALAALFVASSLRAEDKPMAPPKPAAEMSQLSYMVGTWNCSGKTFATPFGPEHATAGRRPRADGAGRVPARHPLRRDEDGREPDAVPRPPGHRLGRRPEGVRLDCFDVFGGTCTQTSPGWKGDALVFEGTALMGGQKMGARDTFTKVSATEMKHKGEMQGADGKWMAGDEETCKKAARRAKK